VTSLAPILLLGLAGFSFGGAYAMFAQRKPMWSVAVLGVFGAMCLTAGWLYLVS
jgi:hypothetical protein